MASDKDKKTKFTYVSYHKTAIDRVMSGANAFFIWKWIDSSINTNNEGGKERAERNAAIFSVYATIFQQIRISMYKTFVTDLSVFFDKNGYDGNFSLDKLIQSTKDKLSAPQIEELKKNIEIIKRKHSKDISFILSLRNSDVAHQELDAEAKLVIFKNIEELISSIQEILNLISSAYERSVHWWDHIEREVDHKMNWLVDNLERGEIQRLEEMEDEFKQKKSN